MSSKLLNVRYGLSYGRVSTVDQFENEDGTRREDASPEMQKVKNKAYIDSLNARSKDVEYRIKEHLSDDGFSAKNTNRPNYQRMCSEIASGKIDFIVASEISRLNRNTTDFLELLNHCERYNVHLMIIDLNLDTSSPIGRVIVTMLVTLAQFEREMTGLRVKDNAKARLITDGKINGTIEVLGLDKDPDRIGHFVPNREEIKTVELVFEIYLVSPSKRETIKILKSKNITWKRGEDFTLSRLNSLLNCVKYRFRGVWPLNQKSSLESRGSVDVKTVTLPHGRIIDEELLNSVEQKMDIVRSHKRGRGKGESYLLSSLLEYEDGTTFTGQPAKDRQYFYYYNRANSIRVSCNEIDEELISRFMEYLSEHGKFSDLISKAMNEKLKTLPELKRRIQDLKTQLVKIDSEEAKLRTSALSKVEEMGGEELIEFFQGHIKKLNFEKARIKTELEQKELERLEIESPITAKETKASIKELTTQYKRLNNSQKRALLEGILSKVVYRADHTIELHFLDDCHKKGRVFGKKYATSSPSGIYGGSAGT